MTMTPTDLRAALARLGLTQSQAARLLKINPRTMRRWIAGDWPVPHVAVLALRALDGAPRGAD